MIKLSILNIVHDTTVDGPGFRTAIYAAGCIHHCPGCHNPQSWDMNNGSPYSIESLLDIIKEDDFSNVTFSGGDPLMQIEGFTILARMIKKETKKNIWCYTGFPYEQIVNSKRLSQILPFLDVMVDRQYISALRNEDLQFKGSSNQRIIDIRQSLATNKIIIHQNNDPADVFYLLPENRLHKSISG